MGRAVYRRARSLALLAILCANPAALNAANVAYAPPVKEIAAMAVLGISMLVSAAWVGRRRAVSR
jgi:hypothetical protein